MTVGRLISGLRISSHWTLLVDADGNHAAQSTRLIPSARGVSATARARSIRTPVRTQDLAIGGEDEGPKLERRRRP